MNYIKIRLTFNPGSKYIKTLIFNANTIPHCKISFYGFIIQTKFPKGGISEQFNEGYKDLGGINTDLIRKFQL